MPWGVCHGCLDEGPLPPFGEGYCFLCATDGPPGDRSTTGRAVGEDNTAPDPTAAWNEGPNEDQIAILELFAEANVLPARARMRAAIFSDALAIVRYPDAGARYAERKAAGLCVRCPREAAPGHVLCVRCGGKEAARQRALRLRAGAAIRQRRRDLWAIHKAAGRCVYCRTSAAPGSIYCDRHEKLKLTWKAPLEKARVLAAKNRVRKARLGLCRQCASPAEPGLRVCAKHREDNRAQHATRWAAAIATGRCERCPAPATHGRCCERHREVERERVREARQRRRESPPAVCKMTCATCGKTAPHFQAVSGKWLPSPAHRTSQIHMNARREEERAQACPEPLREAA